MPYLVFSWRPLSPFTHIYIALPLLLSLPKQAQLNPTGPLLHCTISNLFILPITYLTQTPTTIMPNMNALLQTLLLALAATAAASPPPLQRDSTAAIIGTFSNGACSAGQQDWSDAVAAPPGPGTCHELPGDSMKIWWVKKGCLGTYIVLCF